MRSPTLRSSFLLPSPLASRGLSNPFNASTSRAGGAVEPLRGWPHLRRRLAAKVLNLSGPYPNNKHERLGLRPGLSKRRLLDDGGITWKMCRMLEPWLRSVTARRARCIPLSRDQHPPGTRFARSRIQRSSKPRTRQPKGVSAIATAPFGPGVKSPAIVDWRHCLWVVTPTWKRLL